MYFVYGTTWNYNFLYDETVFVENPDDHRMYTRELMDAHQFDSKDDARKFIKDSKNDGVKWSGILEKI